MAKEYTIKTSGVLPELSRWMMNDIDIYRYSNFELQELKNKLNKHKSKIEKIKIEIIV